MPVMQMAQSIQQRATTSSESWSPTAVSLRLPEPMVLWIPKGKWVRSMIAFNNMRPSDAYEAWDELFEKLYASNTSRCYWEYYDHTDWATASQWVHIYWYEGPDTVHF